MVKFEGVKFQSAKYIQQHYNISGSTLRRWGESGKINTLRTSERGKRLYDIHQIEDLLGRERNDSQTHLTGVNIDINGL